MLLLRTGARTAALASRRLLATQTHLFLTSVYARANSLGPTATAATFAHAKGSAEWIVLVLFSWSCQCSMNQFVGGITVIRRTTVNCSSSSSCNSNSSIGGSEAVERACTES
eukprot:1317-Heterococcus_DN1.PRE.1